MNTPHLERKKESPERSFGHPKKTPEDFQVCF